MGVRNFAALLSAAALVVSAGCGDVQADLDVSMSADFSSTQAISNPTPVPDDLAVELGLAWIVTPPGSCSGVLMNSDWVLTAAHCNSEGGTVVLGGAGSSHHRNVAEVKRHPEYLEGRGGFDLALLRLESHLPWSGMRVLLSESQSTVSRYDLVGKSVSVYGAGCIEPYPDCGGRGEIYTADLVVDSILQDARADYLHAWENDLGQLPQRGDSGGPWFFQDNGTVLLAGIHSQGTEEEAYAQPVDLYADWIRHIEIPMGHHYGQQETDIASGFACNVHRPTLRMRVQLRSADGAILGSTVANAPSNPTTNQVCGYNGQGPGYGFSLEIPWHARYAAAFGPVEFDLFVFTEYNGEWRNVDLCIYGSGPGCETGLVPVTDPTPQLIAALSL